MPQIIKVTKLDGARRQLATAIELWFDDRDVLSIHTLAAAAHQVIHDLNRRRKGAPLLLDSELLRKEYRSTVINAIKFAQNFLKHADRGNAALAESMEFDPLSNELLIGISILGLTQLGEQLTDLEIAFEAWEGIHRPHFLTDAGQKLLRDGIKGEAISRLRKIPKKEFLQGSRYWLPLLRSAH